MIYIYAPRPSDGARDLTEAIREAGGQSRRVRTPQGLGRVRAGDLVVGWGHGVPRLREGVRVLNARVTGDKLAEHRALAAGGVPVPALSDRPREGYVGRSRGHQGGTDLLAGRGRDYWVQRIETVSEFRVHVMGGVSIRAGMKVPREGFRNPHPWVRSYDGGWRLSYGGECQRILRQATRDAAKEAVRVLGYDFGAVDVAQTARGPIVFEVNKAPGLEGGTLVKYAQKLIALQEGGR